MFGSVSSFGLDLGPTALRVVEMRRGAAGRLLVRAFDRLDLPAEAPQVSGAEGLRRALALFSVSHRVRPRDVVVAALGGLETDNRVVSLPPVSGKRLLELAKVEAANLRASPGEGARHAFLPLPRLSVNERRVLLAAHPAPAVVEALAALASAGASPDAISPAPLAVANFLLLDNRGVEDALVVHGSPATTDVLCLPGDFAWFRTLPFGTREIARSLAGRDGGGTKAAEAARISLTRGESSPGSEEAVRAFLERLVAEVSKALDFHRRRIGAFVPTRVFLAGEIARLPGADARFAEAFHIRVEPLVRLNRIRVSREAYASRELRDLPSFAVALGAALQGLVRVAFPISFCEPDPDRSAARTAPRLTAAALLLLGGAASGDLLASRWVERTEALAETVRQASEGADLAWDRRERMEAAARERRACEALSEPLRTRDLWEETPALALAALGSSGALADGEFRAADAGLRLEFALVVPDAAADPEAVFASRVAAPLRDRAGASGVSLRAVETPPPGAADLWEGEAARLFRGSAEFGGAR